MVARRFDSDAGHHAAPSHLGVTTGPLRHPRGGIRWTQTTCSLPPRPRSWQGSRSARGTRTARSVVRRSRMGTSAARPGGCAPRSWRGTRHAGRTRASPSERVLPAHFPLPSYRALRFDRSWVVLGDGFAHEVVPELRQRGLRQRLLGWRPALAVLLFGVLDEALYALHRDRELLPPRGDRACR